jgi:hypothetical protein
MVMVQLLSRWTVSCLGQLCSSRVSVLVHLCPLFQGSDPRHHKVPKPADKDKSLMEKSSLPIRFFFPHSSFKGSRKIFCHFIKPSSCQPLDRLNAPWVYWVGKWSVCFTSPWITVVSWRTKRRGFAAVTDIADMENENTETLQNILQWPQFQALSLP